MMEETWKEAQGHTSFVEQMIEEVKNGKRFVLFPRPQIVDSDKMVHVLESCVACGELLESTHVVGLFMLEC